MKEQGRLLSALTESQNKAEFVKHLSFNDLSLSRGFYFLSFIYFFNCFIPTARPITETRASCRQNCVGGGLLSLILFVSLALYFYSLSILAVDFMLGIHSLLCKPSNPFNTNPCPRSRCPQLPPATSKLWSFLTSCSWSKSTSRCPISWGPHEC